MNNKVDKTKVHNPKIAELLQISNVIQKRINFEPAQQEDKHQEYLKSKYIPCNNKNNAIKKEQTKLAQETKKPKVELFSDEDIKRLMKWNEVKKIGAGYKNLGNTCFLNSALQCLSYTPPLANCAIQKCHSKTCVVSGFCLFCALEEQIAKTIDSHGVVISPKNIVSNLKNIAKHFRLGRQEDSHEFIRYIVDGIQKSCLFGFEGKLDPKIAETTIVHKIFGGCLQSQVKCLTCNFKSNTIDPFLDLCLEIQGNSLQSCLAKFTQPEILDKDNKYKCPGCKKLVRAQKQFTIRDAPRVLTIQLKRFNFLSLYGGKIDKLIPFPEKLDMGPYISKDEPRTQSCIYKLYAVLVHWGSSTRSGHYYSFVKSSANIWHCMDDSTIKQVSLSTVLQQKAYMLFYIKETPNTLSSNTLSTNTLSTTDVVVSTPTKRKLDDVSIFGDSKKIKTETMQSNNNVNINILSHLQNNIVMKSDTLNANKQKDNLTNKKKNQKETDDKVNTQSKLKEKEENVVKMLLNQSNNPYKITGVETWDGKTSASITKTTTPSVSLGYRYTEDDAMIDLGREKKIKKKKVWNSKNPFQIQQNDKRKRKFRN